MAVAERLYYDSGALEFEAVVADIRLDSRGDAGSLWQVALDRTAFYPEGGGQPWDTGTLTAVSPSGARLEVEVERVEEDESGEVWHFVRKPLVEGTAVTGRVNAERRMDHAQQHTGQHLLSAVFLGEVGARTVSFHLGAESSTIDLVLRDGVERLSDAELVGVEGEVNRLIYADRAMRPGWVEAEEARAMLERGELRKLPERVGRMRIVEMEGVEFNACGGTHVASTGAIGGLMLRKVEKAKQGWRVEFVCGLRAVRTALKLGMELAADH
ncbi:MAG: alanyl-tRNA editing protein, partial [Acidobacteriota bacterium]